MEKRPERVLVVEDNLLVNQLLGDMVQSLGFAVTTAFSLDQARRALAENSFDCLLTDINLDSEPSGLRLMGEALDRGAVRVILISGHPRPGDLGAGVAFLAKPFTVSQLQQAFEA